MRLEGKVALVTGSSRGIGREVASRLAREGADVAIHYNSSREGADEALATIREAGRKGHAFKADLSSAKEARTLVEETVAHFGALDILVNNAGLEKKAPFLEVTEKDYDAVLNVNLKAPFFASQALVAHLRKEKRPGKIIMMSSVHEELPFPGFAAYCASKGGLRMLVRNLAVELGEFGITVNGVAPGAIETEINAKLLADKEKVRALLENIPLGRLGKPKDVASVVAFLASSDADYVTGATYLVDGGLSVCYHER